MFELDFQTCLSFREIRTNDSKLFRVCDAIPREFIDYNKYRNKQGEQLF